MAAKEHTKRKEARSAWQEAEAAGFDMSLVEENLRMTPWERLLDHGRAMQTAMELQSALKKRHGRT